jgi:hypothetical protein
LSPPNSNKVCHLFSVFKQKKFFVIIPLKFIIMNAIEGGRVIVVDSSTIDTALPESMREVRFGVHAIDNLRILGLDMRLLVQRVEQGEPTAVEDLHKASALLHSDWQNADRNGNEDKAVAIARLFNKVNESARSLQETSVRPFDIKAIKDLARYIEGDIERERQTGAVDFDEMAEALYDSARRVTHWNSWAYRLLPSRHNQPYTSMGIASVRDEATGFTTHITQTAVRKARMFSHMHGLSTAFSAALGDPSTTRNTQRNIIWGVHSQERAFPLRAIQTNTYDTKSIACIPPRWLHTIVKADSDELVYPSLDEVVENPELIDRIVQSADFGLQASLHVYRPTNEMIDRYRSKPYPGVWEDTGMIAMNHKTEEIFLGSLHAMELRMASWKDGKCCGACFVEDDRRITVPFSDVSELIYIPQPNEILPEWRMQD